MADSPETVIRNWFEQLWNQGREDAIPRLFAADGKAYGLAPNPICGPAEFLPLYRAFRQAFPDMHIDIERCVASGDMVAVHCHVKATHSGTGFGPVSDQPVDFWGFCMARVKDGQLVEGWNCFDFMTCYQQIGLLPQLAL
jgi:predicted SnoaL-like aldol condensation-catalyzing enzyme